MGQARRRGRRGPPDRRQVAELALLVGADRPLAGEGVVRPLEVSEALAPLAPLAEGDQSHLDGIR